jgi:nitronate monooxygenase
MPRIETALTRLLGIEHPIFTAPMSGIAGGALANAVSHAGGLGIIGPGADAAAIRREVAAAGNARVAIGFIAWRLERNPSALAVALEAGPAAVMLSFGAPAPFCARIKAAGCMIICQVQSVAMAQEALDAGADILIAQGRDAGGHSGNVRGTIGLVPAVVDIAGSVPVVAAGGIADGRGLAAALALGAAGVSMGTRFTATRESLWSDARKAAVTAGHGDQTVQTRIYDTLNDPDWPRMFPARMLRNPTYERWEHNETDLEAVAETERARFQATPPEDLSQRMVLAGEAVDLIHDVPSARYVVERIVAEAISVLRGGAALVRD